MDRADRGHSGVLGGLPLHHSDHYRTRPAINALPSIRSVFGDFCRPPRGLNLPYSYPEPPIQTSGPSTLPQYPSPGDGVWHKQGQQHSPTPLTSTIHFQKTNPEYTQSQYSPNNSEPTSCSRRALGGICRRRPPMSPTTETTVSNNDNCSITDMYSDPGESEINSGIGDTQSQAGSAASGMYQRRFVCKTCKAAFKCDSLRRKHEMKHTKPFKCPFQDCKRKGQGFTSANDRDRHMNSVHKNHLNRPAIGYDCCYDHCRGNGKIFWRLDNFRNHLKKKHDPKGSKEQLEEFLKRAETDCRRAIPPPGADTSMDTRSEPEYSMSCTSMKSPGPAMSMDFCLSRRSQPPPPVVRLTHWESASESGGIVQLPISPVSRGPHRDVESDPGDRMDIDEIPESATPHPRAAEPLSDTQRTSDPKINGSLSHANSKVSSEGKGPGKESSRASPEALREKEELFEKIKEMHKYIQKYNVACDKMGDYYSSRYELVEVRYSPSDASVISNNDECDMDESHLLRVEDGGPDCMDRDDFGHPRASHSLQTFITQDPTEESVMSRLLSSGGTAAPTAVAPSSATQVDTQRLPRQLASPPTSVASPQAATTEIPQAHQQQQQQTIVIPEGGLPTPDPTQSSPTRSSHQGPRVPPHGTTQKNVASLPPQNGKSTTCSECGKSFTMPSKLKKHMKRHSRPYACTFRGCGKLFGSKNDWKRHENSQHFQLELWKCGVIPPNTSNLCGKLSYRRESHTTHLRSVHGITDKHEIASKTAEAHIGRNNFRTFWCGFCPVIEGQEEPRGVVVHLEKKGLGGWDERFDHLGKHFIDEGLDIGRYKFHDDDDQYGPAGASSDDEDDREMTVAEPAPAEKRLKTAGTDCVLEDYDAPNGRQKIVTSTAPDREKRGEELAQDEMGSVDVKESLKPKPRMTQSPTWWYCCQKCSYAGPYITDLVASCVGCEHRICEGCVREPNGNTQTQ